MNRNLIKTLIPVLLFFSSLWAETESVADFYYSEETVINLQIVRDQISVVFKDNVSSANYNNVLKRALSAQFKNADEKIFRNSRLAKLSDRLSVSELSNLLKQLINMDEILSAAPIYRYPKTGVRQAINQDFIIRFGETVLWSEIQSFCSQNKITIKNKIADQTYLLSISPATGLNGLSAANMYNDAEIVRWAQPNFIYLNWEILNSSVNDTYWPQQWAHKNSGQQVSSGAGDSGFPATVNGYSDADMDVDHAWDYLASNGSQAGGNSSVLIAMLDSGVDLDHPDLQSNLFSTGKDFTDDGQTDADDSDGHGTCTAGIVAAVGNNGQGVAGVAYNSKILPLRIMNKWGVTSTNNLVQAFDYAWQQGADVISNSWTGTTPETALTEAIQRAKTQGRSGLGCVIVFSSGNKGNGTVEYPADLDEVIAVGASNMFDEKKNSGSQDYNRKWSSNYGAALDLVAPTIVYTTDIQGTAGFVDGDYFDHFGGTSASCPNVAGVAALMLAANSGLTSDEVQQTMQNSADKIERYSYNSSGWNKYVGYGRVNALNAVQAAQSNDGYPPLAVHQWPASTSSIEPRVVSFDISDENGLAGGPDEPRLYYRTIFESDTSAWASVTDTNGPSGDTYSFTIPGQKWSTQVQYYLLVKDNSAEGKSQTYPFGGNGSEAPECLYIYHVGDFSTKTYSQSASSGWENNYQDYHTSTLNISEDIKIVDLNVTLDYTGNLNEVGIDLTGPDDKGAGLAMHYEGGGLSNTEFDDEAAQSITDGTDPFTGSYQADNGLFTFDGKKTAGDWKIGVYDGEYTGSNDGSVNSWSLDITYMLPNAVPIVTDILAQTVSEGGSFTAINLDDYVSDADDPDDSLSWSYGGNQDLTISINANHQATVTIPDENWYGSELITFTVMDPGGYTDSDTVLFTVNGINDSPVVTTIPDQKIDEGQKFSTISLDDYVSDIDNTDSEMNWHISGNQEFTVTIDQNRVATISMPNNNWNGQETITFKAIDPGDLADSTAAVFTVNAVNDAPVIISQADTTALEDELYEYQVVAKDVDEGAVLSYVLLTSPAFLSINSSGLISGTPGNDDVGTHDVSLQVKDQFNAADTQNYQLTVDNENNPPVVSEIPDQTIDEGQTFSTISLDDYVDDPDNADSEMDWTYSGNTELTIKIDAKRIATISIPDSNWNGQETITFKATDPGSLADSNAAVFTVNSVNDAPVITSEAVLNATQDVLYQYQVTAADVDEDAILSYALLTAPSFLSISSGGLISGTPGNDDVGAHDVSLQVKDQFNAADTQNYRVTVDNENNPPVVSEIPDQTIDEGQTFSTISLDDYVDDPDNADSEMDWAYSGSTELTIKIDAKRIATISIPDSNWNGQETITFKATDPGSMADSNAAVFTVQSINDAPVITSEPVLNATQDVLYQYQVMAADVDEGAVLSYALLTAPSFLSISSSGLISGTPGNDDVGAHDVSLQVKDQFNAADTQNYRVTVQDVNDAPYFTGTLPEITFLEDGLKIVQDDFWFSYVEDADDADEDLQYTVQNDQQFVYSQQDVQESWTFTAADDWYGSDTLSLRINDAVSADSALFFVRVLAVNDAPEIVNLPDSLRFSSSQQDTLQMADYQSDIDSPEDKLLWHFETSDTALKTNFDSDTKELILSAPGFKGYVDMYMTLSDDSAAVTCDTLLINVLKDETALDPIGSLLPGQVYLYQNYPNPFNPTTIINYQLTIANYIELSVYNILGQKVRTLVSRRQEAGKYSVSFDASALSNGVYYYKLTAASFVQIRKMILLK